MAQYIIENFETEETIKIFNTNEERANWIDANVTDGYTKDGIKISIYDL